VRSEAVQLGAHGQCYAMREWHGSSRCDSAQDDIHRFFGTYIFGLTGNALSEDVAEFQRAGCDEVLTKPLHMDLLKRLLSEYGLVEDFGGS